MKKLWVIIAVVVLVGMGVVLHALRRPMEEVPEITVDVTVVEPVNRLVQETTEPLLAPPSSEEPSPWVHTEALVDLDRLTRVYEPQHEIGVVPGAEMAPEPPPLPEPRGPEVIEPFDHEEHHQALIELAPVHHARMAEARMAMEALAAYEEELLQKSEYQEQQQAIEALRAALEAADASELPELQESLASQEQALQERLRADAKWLELQAEADGANQRRENVRQEIVQRVQNRMRHDFAVKRAERAEAVTTAAIDDNE